MKLNPYLHFRGDCADAMHFYAEVFGAAPPVMMRYSDAPEGALPEGATAAGDRIMHAQISFPGGDLMASDTPPGAEGAPQAGFSLCYWAADVETGRALLDRLGAGGTVRMPFGPTFWSPGFGMVVDRFGTSWMVGVPGTPPEG